MQIWTKRWSVYLCLCMGAIAAGCDDSEDKSEDEEAEVVSGDGALIARDLTEAQKLYKEQAESGEGDAGAAGHIGQAHLLVLQDDFDGAIAQLNAARGMATPAEQARIDLRKALVQLRAGRLSDYPDSGDADGAWLPGAINLAKKSELPQGWLIVGEIALAEKERGDAAEFFTKAVEGSAGTAGVASAYLTLLESENEHLVDLSEAVANWSVGMSSPPISYLKEQAVEDFVDIGSHIRDTDHGSKEQMLVWAGRAASIGRFKEARKILAWAKGIEGEQAWRYSATDAIIDCAQGKTSSCERKFKTAEALDAPPAGIEAAKATAAMLIGAGSPAEVEALIDGQEGSAAGARALVEANPCKTRMTTDASGLLGDYIRTRTEWEEQCTIPE